MVARWLRLSIRARLTTVIALILVVGFVTTNLISFRTSTEAIKSTLLKNELPLTSSNIYSEIQADLLRPILVSSLMANDTFLKDWLLGGERDVSRITRYLEHIHREYGVFTSFLISDKTLSYYHFSGRSRHVKPDDPVDAWFFRARAMEVPYEVNVDVNQEQDKQITIFINYRVLDYQGRFIGLTGVGLNLKSVARIISRYHDTYDRNIYFVDDAGKVVVRSNNAGVREDNILTAPGISTIAADLLEREEGYFEYERDGETMLITTRHIPDLGWHVIVEQSEAHALRGLWRGLFTNMAVGFVIICLTIVVIYYAVSLYQRRLEDMAVTDKLTGIGNRQMFELELDQAVRLRRRLGQTFSVVLFDIDHFKQINDSFGHLKGDEVIRKVADAAGRVIRRSSAICRWGGEEFIVLLHGCALKDALEVAERMRATVAAEPLFTPDDATRVTISLGVAEVVGDETGEHVLAHADHALYVAKQAGRNRVVAHGA